MIHDSTVIINDYPHTRPSSWLTVLSHAYLSVLCGRLALLLNLEWTCLSAGDRSKPSTVTATVSPLLLSHVAASDTFDLSVMLCHVRWWSISVSAENDVLSLTLFLSICLTELVRWCVRHCCLQATEVKLEQVNFNAEFISRMIPRLEWPALCSAAESVSEFVLCI